MFENVQNPWLMTIYPVQLIMCNHVESFVNHYDHYHHRHIPDHHHHHHHHHHPFWKSVSAKQYSGTTGGLNTARNALNVSVVGPWRMSRGDRPCHCGSVWSELIWKLLKEWSANALDIHGSEANFLAVMPE